MTKLKPKEFLGSQSIFVKYYKIVAFLLALLSAMAITIDYSVVTDSEVVSINNSLIRCMVSLMHSFNENYILGIFVFIASYLLYISLRNLETTRRTYTVCSIISFLLASCVAVGMSFSKTNSSVLLFGSGVQILKTLIIIFGYFGIIFGVTIWLFNFFDKFDIDESNSKSTAAVFFKNHAFIISIVAIVIFWMPRIISCYPGIFMADTTYQVRQVFGEAKMCISHPAAHTLLFGAVIRPLHSLTGSYNIALYVYTLLQCGFTIVMLAETVRRTTKHLSKVTIPCILLAAYCVVPVFSAYAVTLTKDSLWAPVFMLWMLEVMQLIAERKNYKSFIKFFITSLLVTVIRNNGIYVTVGAMVIFAFALKEHRKKIIACALATAVIWVGINQVFVNVLDFDKGSSREMLSVPFQQTARYVKEYSNEVTNEEKQAIDKVLDYKSLAKNYNPISADPVKETFKENATGDDKIEYFKVWLGMFLKHPKVYIDAFINNTYGYFYFSQTPVIYSSKLSYWCESRADMQGIGFERNEFIDDMRELFDNYYYFVGSIPLIGILLTTAVWQWALLVIIAYLILKKKKNYILAYVPFLILLLTNIAGPVNGSYYYRYEYPIAFCIPYLILWTIVTIKSNDKNKDKDEKDREYINESISDNSGVQ